MKNTAEIDTSTETDIEERGRMRDLSIQKGKTTEKQGKCFLYWQKTKSKYSMYCFFYCVF